MTLPPSERIMDIFYSRYLCQAIYLATQKKIADMVTVAGPPKHSEEIATYLSCNSLNVYRLMSYLASHGIFKEVEGNRFIGNEMSEALRASSQDNCYNGVLLLGFPPQWRGVMALDTALGENANLTTPFEAANGKGFYEYLSKHPEDQRNFDLSVASFTQIWQPEVPKFFDFTKFSSIVDLAGGQGYLLEAAMLANPKIEGTLFELPSAIRNLRKSFFEDDTLKPRFKAVEGDFFKAVDCEADLFTIAMTLHNFNDDLVSCFLANVTKAMRRRPNSHLLIIEIDYDDCPLNSPSGERELDMTMMINTGGRERSLETWKDILRRSGLHVVEKYKIPPAFSGIQCEVA